MQKIKTNKNFYLLVFLALFGFSIGCFDNYRELWMSSNGLATLTISNVISISYIVTVLALFYFTIRVSFHKLKLGMCIALVINMITETVLICLNQSNHQFLIKFFMFFNIAFSQIIIASVYPLMMNISKSDDLYTKKDFVEFFFSKLGFLLVAVLLGKTFFNHTFDYNTCLFLSIIFNFIAFLVLLNVKLTSRKTSIFNLKESLHYFNHHKIIYYFLFTNFLSDVIYSAILGMPLLLLTKNLNMSSNIASYLILGLGIVSSFLSLIIVKYLRFKNDNYNLIFKFGIRIFLYLLVFITNNVLFLWIIIIYILITNKPYSFIFSGYFTNNIQEKYALFLTNLTYCATLLGNALGTLICGLVFNLNYRIFIMPALLISIIHYIVALDLIKKREKLLED